MLVAFILGTVLFLIGNGIDLITAIRRRRTGDIVYWSLILVWFGWFLVYSVVTGKTIFAVDRMPLWVEQMLVTIYLVAGLGKAVWRLLSVRRAPVNGGVSGAH